MSGHRAGPAVELSGVRKRFGEVNAVDGVDLSVDDGEVLALVGSSGCGKSTLLRLVAGLTRCDAGRVGIRGETVDGPGAWQPAERRRVGVVFQEQALFPHLRVADNVAFGLDGGRRGPRTSRGGHGGRERGKRVGEVLDLVAMGAFAERFPHELSGGEQQRVALARALAPGPDVVLLDEPFSDLDRGLRLRVRADTVEVLRRAGATAVFVTHDHEEALAVGERVAVMRAGRLEQVGQPAHVFHAPDNRFVATFLGEADFLPGRRRNGSIVTEAGTAPASAFPDGAEVDVMLRPHEVTFDADPDGDAVVLATEFQGGFVRYTLQLASGRTLRSLRLHTVAESPGTRVRVRLETGHPPAVFVGDRAVAGPSVGGETPGGETPGGETPGGETPGGETPGGETPVADRVS